MSKTAFYKEIIDIIKNAGYELARKNNGHDIYHKEGSGNIVIPRKLDNPRIFYRLIKQSGASHG